MNESMAVNYPKAQSSNDKTLQTRVGVVRKTTVKPNQASKKGEVEEPDIDIENIPVVQGTFQITKTEADITENKKNASPTRGSHKPVAPPKLSTTTKAPTTKATTTKRIPTTTPKPRPFTITSTLNVKTKTDATPKRDFPKDSRKPLQTTSTTTSSTMSAPVSTTLETSTSNNVSQILLDLLTNEHHYKDLPKIDTLFTVPHVIDNEPWKPITRPYYEATSSTPPPMTDISNDKNAEDRIGVAEVVDDVSVLETMLTPIPPVKPRDRTTRKPGVYNVDSDLAAEVYVPSPVYTSFTLPTFSPPFKDMETLGTGYVKPHPIPVDKISSVVEVVPDGINFYDEDDGKPVQRPPKDKTTSVVINVDQSDLSDSSTEKVAIDGASIIKKPNTTTTSTSTTTPSTTPAITSTEPTFTVAVSKNDEKDVNITAEEPSKNTTREISTKRPNNKVSIIPTTGAPLHTWELVNTSTNENDTFSKNLPDKYYNDTLQAIITKNDAVFPNTTPKFPSKTSILRNLTEIIKRYSQNSTEKPVNEVHTTEKVEDRHNHNKMTGSVEVVPDEDLQTTTANVITLLPAKSNLGVNRPLRPRPKIKVEPQPSKESLRSFFRNDPETQKIINELSTENYIKVVQVFNDASDSPEIVTSSSFFDGKETEDEMMLATVMDNIKVAPENNPSKNRLPKSSDDLNKTSEDRNEKISPAEGTNIPEGTYRVSYHVTGSVSSKQANKTQSLPAYELSLEPDVVLEIPYNQTNSLTIDKLKQLASLATISDSNNNTLFRSPGGVISTKAIPSSYTLNQAGFKILTKTYNKLQPSKQDDNSLDKPEKTYSKPYANKPMKDKDYGLVKEVKSEEECSNTTSYRCASGACLPLTSRCNRLLDCPGGEDERACSCADYLRAEFSQSKICDGIVDCWDYTDENKCGKHLFVNILRFSQFLSKACATGS